MVTFSRMNNVGSAHEILAIRSTELCRDPLLSENQFVEAKNFGSFHL